MRTSDGGRCRRTPRAFLRPPEGFAAFLAFAFAPFAFTERRLGAAGDRRSAGP